ncbi:MAG: hypothetical protein M1832_005459 [Thelocarpon impressellum]|nr:MAG: hypothetical protein M1832_005459 [Thelocarpon impressellum]
MDTPHSRRFLSKAHWKGKISSKQAGGGDDGQASEPKDRSYDQAEDVMEFLRPAGDRPPQNTPAQQLGRLDTSRASRWPSASDVRRSSTTPSSFGRSRQTSSSSRGRSHSPKRGKGLTVKFTEEQPEIIGVGGDEADSPPRDISRSRARSHSPVPHPGSSLGSGREKMPPKSASFGQAPDESPQLLPVRRRPTGLDQAPDDPDVRRARGRGGAEDHRPPPTPRETASPHSASSGASLGSFAAAVQAKMRADEGRALHAALREGSPPRRKASPPRRKDDGAAVAGRLHPTPPPQISLQESINRALRSSPPQTSPQAHTPPQYSPAYSPAKYQAPPLVPEREASYYIDVGPRDAAVAKPDKPEKEPPNYLDVGPRDAAALRPSPQSSRPVTPTGDSSAFDDFTNRVQHLTRIFQLAADAVQATSDTPAVDWARAAVWWFLKGRTALELAIRNQASGAGRGGSPHPPSQAPPHQAYIDLAKAWWISHTILPQHPELSAYRGGDAAARSKASDGHGDGGAAEVWEVEQDIVRQLRGLTQSMQKHGFLPRESDHVLLGQGLDTSVWVSYPRFAPDVSSVLSGQSSKSLIDEPPRPSSQLREIIPVRDTSRVFTYGRMFVDALLDDDQATQTYRLPCVLSMTRGNTDWQVSVAIASQSGLVNICVQPDRKLGTSWDDVRWSRGDCQMTVRLPRGFALVLRFAERDYRKLFAFYDSATRAQASLEAAPGEELIFENTLKTFQYFDSDPKSATFPNDAVPRCRTRLFERSIRQSEGTGTRKLHRGFRLMVLTSPKVKTTSTVSHEFGRQHAILFGILRGPGGEPGLMLKVGAEHKQGAMVLAFQDLNDRGYLLSLLSGNSAKTDETFFADVPLKALTIERRVGGASVAASKLDVFKDFGWQQLRLINRDPENPDQDHAQTVLSDALRVCVESKSGTITDRINLGPGQLLWRLNVGSPLELGVLRLPQEDMTMAVVESRTTGESQESLDELLQAVRTSETVRTFSFHTLEDAHAFQAAITGFTVLFDGPAASFAISRRRMVVSISKKWECNVVRVQIVKQAKVVQMVAFFDDFSHGKCMNFQLKGTDFYESFSKGGKFFTRLVDAKFALPKGEGSDSRDFVCLDIPEYAGEHDDIHVAFDREADRDRFQSALPASVNQASRMGSLRSTETWMDFLRSGEADSGTDSAAGAVDERNQSRPRGPSDGGRAAARQHFPTHADEDVTEAPARSAPAVVDLTSPARPSARPGPGDAGDRASREIILPRWQADAEVSACPICGLRFSFWHRKHHCRKCGRVVCAFCSPHRITIPRQFIVRPPASSIVDQDATAREVMDLTADEDVSDVPGTDGALDRIDPGLGGGEEVRICNPCVPDPNYGPPPQSGDVGVGRGGRGDNFRANFQRHRESRQFRHSLGPGSIDPRVAGADAPPQLDGYRAPGRPSVDRYRPPSLAEFRPQREGGFHLRGEDMARRPVGMRGPSYNQEDATSRLRRNAPLPRTPIEQGDAGGPSSSAPGPSFYRRQRGHQQTVSAGGEHDDVRAIVWREPSPTRRRPRRQAGREEDYCPICLVLLPHRHGDDAAEEEARAREQHVESCIAEHFSSSTERHTPPRGAAPLTDTFTMTPTAASPGEAQPGRPRRGTGGGRMVTYLATEKDCVAGGTDEPAECVICFEEFEPGAEMARLECLCKFHCRCITLWWDTRGRAGCPVHRDQEG